MTRRGIAALAAPLFAPAVLRRLIGKSRAAPATLLTAPLDIGGDWGGSPVAPARLVVARVREVALSGIRLLSDRAPQRLRVDDQTTGPPHIWLHSENPDTAWIVVDIGALAWCQLAYQFGHELGHVLCNSWLWKTELALPCRWLEEAMVEAFSIRALALLADSWESDPPFAGDGAYAKAIRQYRANLIEKYRGAGKEPTAAWLRANHAALDRMPGLDPLEGPGILAILNELEGDKTCIEDLGAVNRWPQHSGVPLEEYLALWQTSCAQIKTEGRLPVRLRELFGLG